MSCLPGLFVFSLLLDGAQVQETALRDYALLGRADALRELIAEHPDLDVDVADESGATALMLAAQSGHEAAVAVLLEAGADPNRRNDRTETPLHLAARNARVGVARLLLETGADLEARDGEGRTPLYRAIERRSAEMIELLQVAAFMSSSSRGPASAAVRGEITEPPEIVERAPAPYTASAREKGIEGSVVVNVLVRRDGSVGAARVSRSLEESLDRVALDSVKRWKFQPAVQGEHTVEVVVQVEVEFELPKER